MDVLLKISSKIDGLIAQVGKIVQWLTFAMILIGSFNAVARYLGRFVGVDLSSNSFLEMQWYLFSVVFLLGASYALQADQHVRVDVLYAKLSKKGKAKLNIAGTVLFLIPFCIFIIYVCWSSVINSWAVMEVSPDPGGLPRYPIKTLVPIAFLLLLMQGISQLIKSVGEIRD